MVFFRKISWLFVGCWLCGLSASAQLSVVYPHPHLVIQRGINNSASLFVAGTFSLPIDRVEARLVAEQPDFGVTTDWQLLTNSPQQGIFQGTLLAKGGWYRLDVRGLRNGQLISQTTVDRVGVGEVFLVAGQSNAMGVPNKGAKGASERVVSINASNKYLNSNDVTVSADQPFPMPVFATLTATNLVFPTGETAWCWGEFGNAIARRYGVPVAFFNVGFPGTIAQNWSESAQGQPTTNIFTSIPWPNLQPYANLRNSLHYYHSQLGIRAVLWHHGESDAVPYRTPLADYQRHVQTLIDHSRVDLGQNMAWVVARCSISPAGPISSTAILGAQNRLINTPGNNVWAGPDTDSIQLPRPPDGHFENFTNGEQGLSEFAQSWSQSLTDAFFANATPIQPRQFLRTGLLPAQIPVGSFYKVAYSQIGFSDSPTVRLQLLTEAGVFVMEPTQTQTGNVVQFRLPDTLRTGLYRLRVVGQSPKLAGAPSAIVQVVAASQPLNPLLDIQTERDSTSMRIYWLSAQESAGSTFVIERRTSDTPFVAIGTVSASTDGGLHHLYTFTDTKPVSGTATYRIQYKSPTGIAFSAQSIITGLENLPSHLSLYPNPNTGPALSIRLPANGQWQATFINQRGQVVGQQTVLAFGNKAVTVSLTPTLPAGEYLVQLRCADQLLTGRLLIIP